MYQKDCFHADNTDIAVSDTHNFMPPVASVFRDKTG